jgi:cytochrome c-type biogenesis protein
MHSLPLPLAAFVAGLLSFLSPCVLPLVPGYVSLVSGASVDDLKSSDRRMTSTVMLHSITFIIGFSFVFIVLGAAATGLGQIFNEYRHILARIAGVVVIIFGLHLTGLLKIKALYADKRLHDVKGSSSALGSFVVGFAFAFGWTPCIGPILAGILALAAEQDKVAKGVFLLAIYSMGLAVPFLLTSIGVDRFLVFYGKFRRHLHTVEVISGVLLIAVGTLIFMNNLKLLSGYLAFLNRFAM